MTRFQAAGIHFGISILIALIFLSLVFFVWYPQPYFSIGGGDHLLVLLIGVDITIGPLLTLLVFKAGKPGLKRDLSIIAMLQISALVLGASVITTARPAFVVFTIDRFIVVSANDITDQSWDRATGSKFNSAPWGGPVLVSVPMPEDPKARNALMIEVLSGSTDMSLEPRLYVPYQDDIANVQKHLQDMNTLGASLPEPIASRLVQEDINAEAVGWLPLVGRTRSAMMLIRRTDATPLGLADVDPWPYLRKKQD
ncbi:MAG: hypothetical protein H6981_09030 [Gammaproteobacteria bacterium]|nr:hypothetical protein [Gammaproteobacteria bacterium]MCP5136932.1 hypothetical protein [Gammaproteobacteria bacterium]